MIEFPMGVDGCDIGSAILEAFTFGSSTKKSGEKSFHGTANGGSCHPKAIPALRYAIEFVLALD